MENSTHARFIQPLIHGFLDSFVCVSTTSIPVSFLRHLEDELQGQPLKSVELSTESRRCWEVTIEGGRYFKDGWQEFCLYNQLRIGDFLVFIHQTHLLFQVEVFDPTTACQRLYSPTSKGLEERKVLKIKSTPKRKLSKTPDFVLGLAAGHAGVRQTPSVVKHKHQSTCFHMTLTSHCFKKKYIYFPMSFLKSSGIAKRNCGMTLVDEKERPWEVRLSFSRNKRQCHITRGWSCFQAANNLKPGDVLSFELLEAGERPILKCYRIQKKKNSTVHEEGCFGPIAGSSSPAFGVNVDGSFSV